MESKFFNEHLLKKQFIIIIIVIVVNIILIWFHAHISAMFAVSVSPQ